MRSHAQYFTKREVFELLRVAFAKGHIAGDQAARSIYANAYCKPLDFSFRQFIASDPKYARLEETPKKVLPLP